MRQVDFLIVGQGLAGSVLAILLIKEGKKVAVIDENVPNTSSKKAAGIYNPITGRQMIKTWMADELFPGIPSFYKDLELLLDAQFHHPMNIYRPFFSAEELNDWEGKVAEPGYRPFIKEVHRKSVNISGFLDPFGGLEIGLSGYVNLPEMIKAASKWISEKGEYLQEVFLQGKLEEMSEGFSYGDLEANQVIFCQGPFIQNNPFWDYLPFKLVKGEILELKIDLPTNQILNRGVFMLPKDGVFRVGSTYNHQKLDWEPTSSARDEIMEKMKKIVDRNVELVGQVAGVRPATFDRKPFIGTHHTNKKVGIFNGFGTKGVSLVPFFASQYVNYLLQEGQLNPEADVKRVRKL